MTTLRKIHPKIQEDDLPLWMRQARQNTDWGILITVLLCLLAAWPFLLQPGLPTTNASLNHAFMVADYTEVFREGVLYPRWTSAALNGYGAPIPHYYPPGAAYLTGAMNILFLDNTVLAMRVMYTLIICLAGSMTYAFVTRYAGAAVGVLAAILYVFSPYVAHVTPHTLGDLPGMMVLALYPMLLWGLHRLLTVHRAFDFMGVALTGAMFALVKPETIPVALGIASLFIIWHIWDGRRKLRVFLVIFAGIFAAGLAAFYWIPALLDESLVRWVEAPFTPLPYELTLSGLLAPMRRIDLSQIVPPPQFALGWGLLAFAVPGIVASLLDHKIRHLSVMLLMGTGLILLIGVGIDPTSTWLLGPLSLGFAILGAGALRLKRYVSVGYQRVMLPLFLTLALMLATPVWLAPTWTDSEIDLSRAEQIAYEQRGLGAAVLPPGSAIPGTLLPGVQPNAALIESYSQDSTNALRVNPNDNRLGRRVNLLSGQSHQDRYQVRTDPVVIDIERAYFAGWQARVNGITVPVRADASTGLMQVELPRTTGDVLTVFLGSTAARQGAWLLSWVALMLLIIGAVARLRRQARSYTYVMALLTVQEARLLFIISLGFLAAVLIFARPQSPYTLHVRPGSGVDNAIEVGARTVFGMEVMATQVSDEIVTDQDTLDIMVAWRNVTQRPFSRNYQVSVFLQRPNSDSRWLYVEPVTPGGLPTRRWPVGGYVRTDFSLKIPPSIPVGEYRVGVEVYDCTTRCTLSQRISFTDANGVAVGSTLLLPPVVTIQR